MSTRPPILLFFVTLLLFGCGGPTTTASTPAPVVSTPQPTGPQVDLHEWGVVEFRGDVEIRNSPRRVPVIRHPVTVDKPVIYAHLLGDADHVSMSIVLRSPGGGIAEHFPIAPASTGDAACRESSDELGDACDSDGLLPELDTLDADLVAEDDGMEDVSPELGARLSRADRAVFRLPQLDAVAWSELDIHRGACTGVRTYPSRDSVLCANTGDNTCEVSELRDYETPDGACLTHAREIYEHLFYRLRMPPSRPPLSLEMLDGRANLGNEGEADIVGPLFVMFGSETPYAGQVAVLDRLPASTFVSVPPSIAIAEFPRLFGEALLAAGLTEAEAVAFERAWNEDFMHNVPPAGATLVYLLPREIIDAIAPMEVVPPPREFHRVWIARQRVRG